jgi:hypothetical protein
MANAEFKYKMNLLCISGVIFDIISRRLFAIIVEVMLILFTFLTGHNNRIIVVMRVVYRLTPQSS